MAAPQRREARPATPLQRPDRSDRLRADRQAKPAARKKAGVHRRRFAMLIVIPVLLMLGSVYLHTVSANLGDRVAVLEEQRAQASAEKETLEVQVSKLSAPGRIRSEARAIGMEEPGSANLNVYEKNREDGVRNGGEAAQKNGR